MPISWFSDTKESGMIRMSIAQYRMIQPWSEDKYDLLRAVAHHGEFSVGRMELPHAGQRIGREFPETSLSYQTSGSCL